MLRSRDGGRQLYEMVSFPYYGVYLGILDVYYAAGARQEVHCELVSIIRVITRNLLVILLIFEVFELDIGQGRGVG